MDQIQLLFRSGIWGFRHKRRVKRWTRLYKRYLKGQSDKPPLPVVLQIIPTERCNLRCNMCNQWGDNGYFLNNAYPVNHAPQAPLLKCLEEFKTANPDFLLSIHGGEPMLYPNLGSVLDFVRNNKVDTLISTNGTCIDRHLDSLTRANPYVVYLLSLDGGDVVNDAIRGKNTTKKIRHNISQLNNSCAKAGSGPVKIIINYCVSEYNLDAIQEVHQIAQELNAFTLNFNLRWYLPMEKGIEYDTVLKNEFDINGSGAWRGWTTTQLFNRIPPVLEQLYRRKRQLRHRLLLPFFTLLPRHLSERQAKSFYRDYDDTFGIEACILPSYQVRIHANGDVIYCPGHPDIIAGNNYQEKFEDIYYNPISSQLRQRVERKLLPICSRCCGLYMTYAATHALGKPFVPSDYAR